MKSFEEFWVRMIRAKPELADPKATVTISVTVFERNLRSAFNSGVSSGRSEKSFMDKICGD